MALFGTILDAQISGSFNYDLESFSLSMPNPYMDSAFSRPDNYIGSAGKAQSNHYSPKQSNHEQYQINYDNKYYNNSKNHRAHIPAPYSHFSAAMKVSVSRRMDTGFNRNR